MPIFSLDIDCTPENRVKLQDAASRNFQEERVLGQHSSLST